MNDITRNLLSGSAITTDRVEHLNEILRTIQNDGITHVDGVAISTEMATDLLKYNRWQPIWLMRDMSRQNEIYIRSYTHKPTNNTAPMGLDAAASLMAGEKELPKPVMLSTEGYEVAKWCKHGVDLYDEMTNSGSLVRLRLSNGLEQVGYIIGINSTMVIVSQEQTKEVLFYPMANIISMSLMKITNNW